jgi:hypothetical protein
LTATTALQNNNDKFCNECGKFLAWGIKEYRKMLIDACAECSKCTSSLKCKFCTRFFK